MQVYTGMDIGTGKITKTQRIGIPHYMLDIKKPDEPFSVAEYQKYVQSYIEDINARNKIPILVGGSGLYIQAVLFDYHFSNRKRNETITKKLEERLNKEGNEALHQELKQIDQDRKSVV